MKLADDQVAPHIVKKSQCESAKTFRFMFPFTCGHRDPKISRLEFIQVRLVGSHGCFLVNWVGLPALLANFRIVNV